MREKIIQKDALDNFITGLAEDFQVFAPVQKNGLLAFEEIKLGAEISVSALNTKKSVKELFFPQKELLFSFDLTRPGEMKEPSLSGRKKIIFGLRPCDARSLSVLECVFNGKDFPDPYYLQRKEKTLIITVGCKDPASTCFCSDTGGGPFARENSDLLLYDLDDVYLVEAVTKQGETLLDGASVFADAEADLVQKKNERVTKAQEACTSQVNLQKVKPWLDENFDNAFWDTVHEKCLGCGICTYVCPTCHCFDILDETTGKTGERIRIWDSCMYPLFTLHASGVNPRASGKERMRQRIMHKFTYFVDNHSMVACTGCGRCVQYCPVNFDVRKALNQIQEQT